MQEGLCHAAHWGPDSSPVSSGTTEMMEALTGVTEKFMEEMQVSREMEREGTDNIYSLFREAFGVIKDMPAKLQRTHEVACTQGAPPFSDNCRDLQMPSASHHGWMGVEDWSQWPF